MGFCFTFKKVFIDLFIYLAAPSLSCSMQNLVRTMHWEIGILATRASGKSLGMFLTTC